MIRFVCPFCHFTVAAEDAERGARIVCKGCGKNILVPSGRFDEGCIIGDFIINAHLGKGSIGDVYKATQISLDRLVALKILSQKFMTKKGVADFLKEARQASTLSHLNLVQSYAIGYDSNYIYMAMTYIRGETLQARLKREGRIPVDESLHIIQQVAEALYYAWDECRMIHRDVKPENIMLTEKGIVKLTDLGLAMNQSEWSENMEISGSPSYMSPEQFSGDKLDTRSDIYSLGVTLYQMISGTLPFDADTVTSVAKQHFEGQERPLTAVLPDVPKAVSALVEKMMARNPDDRYANMEELLTAIWTIRQSTAPDRGMIPDVHTISINRLDYEFQQERAAMEKKSAIMRPETLQPASGVVPAQRAGSRLLRMKWLYAALVPAVLAVILLIFLIRNFSGGGIPSPLKQKIAAFETLARDPAYSVQMLQNDQEEILGELRALRGSGDAVRYAESYIRYLYLQRLHSRLVQSSTEMNIKLSQMEKELNELRAERASSVERRNGETPSNQEQ